MWGFSCKLTEKFGDMTSSYLPNDFINEVGLCASPCRVYCTGFMGNCNTHYSHFYLSLTTEYIDGAASFQRIWHGPMKENADSTTSMCMLEWLNEKNGTYHYAFYYDN